ncbi:MAG: stage sporulation family protein [Rhodospirillales bacterium]|jgi:anti-sigma regulatory factor (Ser/Thr protein kinase)|nr:stage sporulation family protein [Rhodospirillales bacterium]
MTDPTSDAFAAAPAIRLRRDLGELVRLADWAGALARRQPQRLAFALDLCLEEAVSNIVKYGVRAAGDPPEIVVTLLEHDEGVALRIEDEGEAFDPTRAAAPTLPATIEDAAVGGLGVFLMRKFATQIRYERIGRRNRLTLGFAPR